MKKSKWKVITQIKIYLIFLDWPYYFDKKYIRIIGFLLVMDCHDFLGLVLYLVEEKTIISSNLYKAAENIFC